MCVCVCVFGKVVSLQSGPSNESLSGCFEYTFCQPDVSVLFIKFTQLEFVLSLVQLEGLLKEKCL